MSRVFHADAVNSESDVKADAAQVSRNFHIPLFLQLQYRRSWTNGNGGN
jgi:hypothetical protein